jgi:hypothetical protein
MINAELNIIKIVFAMKKLMLQPTLLIFVLNLFYTSLGAQSTYALVIGISNYKEITPLQFADKDAVAFAEFLKMQHVQEQNIKLFLNEDATRLHIVDEISTLSNQMKPNDRFYFYFGGHGDLEAQISHDNSLLLLYNSYKTGYFKGDEFLQLSELREWFENMSKRKIEVVFIADACHSGGLIGGNEGVEKTQKALLENWKNITKILSCKNNEYSLEGKQWGGGRGLFSFHLVNGLLGRADDNKDKTISLGELGNYLKNNVVPQANPNVQTPVIMGNEKQQLSFANSEGLQKLEEMERKSFALMTDVNTKNNIDKLKSSLIKLDTTIVETYKNFSKALKDKRVNIHDDSLDCALIHYKKLMTYKLPDDLMQMIKRNMAVGLMNLELELLKYEREGTRNGGFNIKMVEPAIKNLEETINIFGTSHYTYNSLQARRLVLESFRSKYTLHNKNTIDENLRMGKEERIHRKDLLLKSVALEPNMYSTHAMLASSYTTIGKPDSAIYYLERVIKLLPNQGAGFYTLGMAYANEPYKDSLNLGAPHPKAIEYIEKAIILDASYKFAHSTLADLYLGNYINYEDRDNGYDRFYPQVISHNEKLLNLYPLSDEDIPKLGLDNYSSHKIFSRRGNIYIQIDINALLSSYHKKIGNIKKSDEYLATVKNMAKLSNSFIIYWGAGQSMYNAFDQTEDKTYLKFTLDYMVEALKLAGEAIEKANDIDKPLITLHYQQLLVGIGTTHRGLKNYEEAEKFLKKAIAYKVLDNPATGKLKLTGGIANYFKGDSVEYTRPSFIEKTFNGEYHYRMEANTEMVALKINENKPDEALYWYEEAMKVSLAENGNDTMGIPYTTGFLKSCKNIDFKKFMSIREKYFPNAEKVQ